MKPAMIILAQTGADFRAALALALLRGKDFRATAEERFPTLDAGLMEPMTLDFVASPEIKAYEAKDLRPAKPSRFLPGNPHPWRKPWK